LLRRERDPHDARASLLVLTERGEPVVAELRRRLATRLDSYLASWPPGQAVAFAEALARFTLEGPLLAASQEEAAACD
jgi:DNA-binding MarR family transcriptional regulator